MLRPLRLTIVIFLANRMTVEKNMTYFSLGPIAIYIPQPVRYLPKIIEMKNKFAISKRSSNQLMDLRATLEQQFSPLLTQKENVRNPFAGVGEMVLEYGKQLEHSVKAVEGLGSHTRSINRQIQRQSGRTIGSNWVASAK